MLHNRTVILILLVIAQFCCVSLWFAANAVIADLIAVSELHASVGMVTSMVQLGFIVGTLVFAYFSLADRFSPSTVFLICSFFGAASNAALLWFHEKELTLYLFRFITGFFLAGIYPVGMKIASDYFEKDISKALGYLLGALVIGTAFPYLLKGGFIHLQWNAVILTTSSLAVLGGLLVRIWIPDGPFRKSGSAFNPRLLFTIFKNKSLRTTAFGYFGHMWELYAFWAFVPVAVMYGLQHKVVNPAQAAVYGLSFYIIAIGSLSCVIGGYVARKTGSRRIASFALMGSGLCCLFSPFFLIQSPILTFLFLLGWGALVIMDSPQFSSLVTQHAPAENRGSALTIVNCIGFAISICSILLLDFLSGVVEVRWLFLFLLPGPVLGVLALWRSTHT